MLVIYLICAVIEPSLARLFGKVALLPFYATIVLNNWLYGGSHWTFRTVLRLLYIRRVSAFAALLGELGLFALLWRGIELLLAVRATGSDVPVVFITADMMSEELAMRAGANAFFLKPVSILQIRQILETWLLKGES